MQRHTQTLGTNWLCAHAHGPSHLSERPSQLATSLPFRALGRIPGSLSSAPTAPCVYPHHSSDHTARDSPICVSVCPATPRFHQDRKATYSPPSTQAEPSTMVQVQGTELSSRGAGLPLTAYDVLGLLSTLSYCFRYRPFSLCCPWTHREVALHWSTVNLPEGTLLKLTISAGGGGARL